MEERETPAAKFKNRCSPCPEPVMPLQLIMSSPPVLSRGTAVMTEEAGQAEVILIQPCLKPIPETQTFTTL